MKKIISIILSAVIVMGLFSACGKNKPVQDASYTFTVPTDPTGSRSWTVSYDKSGVVSHKITMRDDGENTDVVFSGEKHGTARATVYRTIPGSTISEADDVYVIELDVDRKGAVSLSSPQYGEYEMNCGNAISGAKWNIEYDEEKLHCSSRNKMFESEGDGMQSYDTVYTFTGRHTGAAHVHVTTYLSWCDITNEIRDEWLYVDGEYRVTTLRMTEFESFRLEEQGTMAVKNVYEAVSTDDGVRLSRFDTYISGDSDEEERINETVTDGDETVYRTLAGLLNECDTESWDGFSGSDPRVLDGSSFTFEAKLKDGKRIYASGSNAFPDGYRTFENGLYSCMKANKSTD
ncbi:MAG: hypothetical protein K6F09_09650 [Clostridiales bacterium]|nr:hypothetical protein [Clostridiales bacterium]